MKQVTVASSTIVDADHPPFSHRPEMPIRGYDERPAAVV